MLKCGKRNKEKAIQEIMELLKKMPHLFSGRDPDQFLHLTVPMAQLKALFLIVNGSEVNSRTLAEDLSVTPGNITGIVDRLAEQELVVRKPDPKDRRVIWLEATPKGKELVGKLIEDHSRQFAFFLDYMKEGELIALKIGLNGLIKAVEGHLSKLKDSTVKTKPQI